MGFFTKSKPDDQPAPDPPEPKLTDNQRAEIQDDQPANDRLRKNFPEILKIDTFWHYYPDGSIDTMALPTNQFPDLIKLYISVSQKLEEYKKELTEKLSQPQRLTEREQLTFETDLKEITRHLNLYRSVLPATQERYEAYCHFVCHTLLNHHQPQLKKVNYDTAPSAPAHRRQDQHR